VAIASDDSEAPPPPHYARGATCPRVISIGVLLSQERYHCKDLPDAGFWCAGIHDLSARPLSLVQGGRSSSWRSMHPAKANRLQQHGQIKSGIRGYSKSPRAILSARMLHLQHHRKINFSITILFLLDIRSPRNPDVTSKAPGQPSPRSRGEAWRVHVGTLHG
jgi:hypothetical protein